MTRHVLFVCSRNRLRSPTAEQVFADWPGVETASAGLSPDADVPVTPELLAWADTIFVMERVHRARLSERFAPHLRHARVICLDIPDDYDFMAPRAGAPAERESARASAPRACDAAARGLTRRGPRRQPRICVAGIRMM
ncbi:putative protein tyrosine phosphatase [Luteimonas sp. 3794]|nr:putative protein tyrosine phosphatase [Luteimonas sp. 3794]